MLTDLRHTLRTLGRAPGYAATVIVTLALGIAVTSAVFSLANWLALRPLPGITNQSRLAMLDFHRERNGGVSYPDLEDLRARMTAFQGSAALTGPVPLALHVEGSPPRYVSATLVSSDYFSVLGVRMQQGRSFTREEEAAGPTALVVVISDRIWKSTFGSDPKVLGRSATVSGLPATVVGVTPPAFHGTGLLGDLDVWVPGTAQWALAHFPGNPGSPLSNRADKLFTHLVGRLAPGATIEQAGAQLRATTAALAELYPKENGAWEKTPPTMARADGVATVARDYVRRVLQVLMAAAALVLLLACANVANLLLSRAITRRGEVAVRRALGGSRPHLIRSQIAESVLLSAVAGILPGVASTGGDLLTGLKGWGATGAVGRGRLRGTLVALQLAISAALLVTALLLVRTARNLGRIPVGFDADRVASFAIWPAFSGYTTQQSETILRQSLDRVRSIPGVEAAALSGYAPFASTIGNAVQRKGAAARDPAAPAVSAWVGPGYFETMGITLLTGRGFSDDESFPPFRRGLDHPAVVSASQARSLFGTLDVVGRLVQNQNASLTYRIIGVAPDTRWAGLLPGSEKSPLYQPLFSVAGGGVILVRSRLPMSELRLAVQRAVAAVAPSVPLFDEERLSDKVARSVSEPLLLARTLPAFTLVAVLLAGLGLYAVVAFSVAERTREMGIRIALGARADQVMSLVLRQATTLGVVGLVAGLAGAVGLGRVVASRLYGVSPIDGLSYLLAAGILFALVLVASAVPARRATRVDPMVALRYD